MMGSKTVTILLLVLAASCQHTREESAAQSSASPDKETVLTFDKAKQMSGNIVVEVQREISAAGPLLYFQLISEHSFSNWHYRIEIRNKAGEIIQTLKIRNGIPIQKEDFQLQDLDADGFLDVRVLGGTDKSGQKWYKSWRYAEKTKQYTWMKE